MSYELKEILTIFLRRMEKTSQGSVVNCPSEQTTMREENWIQDINHQMTEEEIEKKAEALSKKINKNSTHQRIYSPILFKERGVEGEMQQTAFAAATITGRKIDANKIEIKVRAFFVPK